MAATDLKNAIARIIFEQGVVPSTTLAQAVHIGDTSVTLTNPAAFIEGGMLVWPDAFAYPTEYDEPLAISSVNGSVITPSFEGVGYSGFQFNHPSGTNVCTNLVAGAPNDVGDWLARGDPVVFSYVLDDTDNLTAGRTNQAVMTALVQYERMLIRPAGSQINTNVWALRQQEAALADLETIAAAIRTNPRLTPNVGTYQAEALGQKGQASNHLKKEWNKLANNSGSVMSMIGTLRFTVREKQIPF